MKLSQSVDQKGIVHFLPVFLLAFLVISVALTMMLVQKQQGTRSSAGSSTVCQLSLPNTCTDFTLITDLTQLFRLAANEWDIRVAIDALSNDGSEEAMLMRGRSPVNFNGRTEKITFTAATDFTTQNFVELWVTKDGIRYPQGEGDFSLVQDAVLIEFTFGGVGVITYQNGVETQIADSIEDFQGTAARNKIDVELATNHIKVYSDGRLLIDTPISPALNFNSGYANVVHGAIDIYCDPTDPNNPPTCTDPNLHIDNAGYDGPQTTFSVVGTDDNDVPFVQMNAAPIAITLNHPTGGSGKLWFSAYGVGNTNGQYRINNGTWQTISVGADCDWYTYQLPATFVAGSNLIEFQANAAMNTCTEDTDGYSLHRIDLEVNTGTQTASPTPTPTIQPIGTCTTTSTSFTADTNGAQAGTNSTATGTTSMTLQGTTLNYSISTAGLNAANVTAAHIHGPASPGQDAGIMATLYSNAAGSFGNPHTGSITVNTTTLNAMRNGQAYVNVHTNAFPNGEIRGQIGCPGSGTPTPTPASTATPTPTPTTPPATNTPTPTPRPTNTPIPTATPTQPPATNTPTPTPTGVRPEADRADIDHNGVVATRDLSILLTNFGRQVIWPQQNPSEADRADIDMNSVVATRDLSVLLTNFGRQVTW